MKEMMCVCVGSCFGGCLRYLVGRWMELWVPPASFPYATLAVNVVGCFLIGVLAAMANVGGISPMAKLLLVTGFCGAFTTFSTFMNDNLLMARDGQMLAALLYTVLSMVLGMAAVVAGYQVVK